MKVLGIDPGSRICGWGIVEEQKEPRALVHIDCGLIAPKSNWSQQKKLAAVYDGIMKVIKKYNPDEVAIENVFFAKNAKSALILGQARGVAILAAEHGGLKISEYSPNEIKNAVCGFGHAQKKQVGLMVKAILNLPEPAQTDAGDALACAICHCNSYKIKKIAGGKRA